MLGKLTGWDDTIAALATAPGLGAIAVIRISGPEAFSIADRLFPSKKISGQKSHTLHVGLLKKDGELIDEVVMAVFRGPHSYTGEDVVEISCHGSPLVQQQVLDACLAAGARLARPGEFTQRAFLNGKLDLAQAEAVADLIASQTDNARKAALQTMRGGFSGILKGLREDLLQFSALMELELDFAMEDVEFADRGRFYTLIEKAEVTTRQLLDSFAMGNVIRNGVQVAIVGKPNAGKSTLLNALLNENRAIVSDIAGTTRDTIEEILNIDGILFRLIDTAGIREHTADIIESLGMARSREKMEQADVVLYLFDAGTESEQALRQQVELLDKSGTPYLLVANKVDLVNEGEARERWGVFPNLVFIAARSGRHLEVLKERLTDTVLEGRVQAEGTVVTNARHYHALRQVLESLTAIRAGLDQQLSGDLLAPDIRRCLHYLGEITGEISTEDQLDYIFSKFCIGK